jgi:hypothetical protein
VRSKAVSDTLRVMLVALSLAHIPQVEFGHTILLSFSRVTVERNAPKRGCNGATGFSSVSYQTTSPKFRFEFTVNQTVGHFIF